MSTTNTKSEYDTQAETFLSKHGLKFRATLSDSKNCPWQESYKPHFRVTISRDGYKRKRGWYEWQNRNNGHPGVLFGPQSRLTFDFWGSISDCECRECRGKKTVKLDKPEPAQVPNPMAGKEFNMGTDRKPVMYQYPSTLAAWKRDTTCQRCNGSGVDPEPKHPSAYDVLACISSDACTPETFSEFISEFGGDPGSLKELQNFRRCARFAKRLRAFFTPGELQDLSEIQ